MNTYTVTVKHTNDDFETGAAPFAQINFGEDGYSEFERYNEDGNEIYTIYTDLDIDRALDLSDGVISYTVETQANDEENNNL